MEAEHIARIKEKINSSSIEDEFHCLRSICLSITDYCNLSCSYCPHATFFKNRKIFMKDTVVEELSKQLRKYHFDGMISISGMGEPTLHPNLIEIVKTLSMFSIQVISNGLNSIDYKELTKYAELIISLHRKEDLHLIQKNLGTAQYILRNHDISDQNSSFTPCNRYEVNSVANLHHICHYPFYKTTIDYDGSYLLCQEDWKRYSKKHTIFDIDIYKYFTEYLHNMKMNMYLYSRNILPCSCCNVDGRLIGEEYVEYFKQKYIER